MKTPERPGGRHQRQSIADSLAFFGTWLRAPRTTGAVVPSSRALARAMAAEVDPTLPGHVIELGGGTGQFTRALLERGLAPQRVIVIERDPGFARLLRERLPEVRVVSGDARELAHVLRSEGVEDVAAIVSGLPFLSMPKELCDRILAQCAACLRPGRALIQFTYGPSMPFKDQPHGFSARPVKRVLRNVPPATVWRYSRTGDTVASPCRAGVKSAS